MTEIREAFEEAAARLGFDLAMVNPVYESGEYIGARTQDAWEMWAEACGWQADRAQDGGEPLEIWLGAGDKIIADIYAKDGSHAGIGIFEPENGSWKIGESDGQIDGRPLDETNAIVLIQSTSVESLQVLIGEIEEAINHMGGATLPSAVVP